MEALQPISGIPGFIAMAIILALLGWINVS